MFLYNTLRTVNGKIKKYKKKKAGRALSPCRRIEFVYPPSSGKYVAMTFDDGPTRLKTTSDPDKGLTSELLDILSEYGAKGTFDVIGTTGGNYPDKEGPTGDFSWSGVHFDHYPMFGKDADAGAKNCPELIEKILSGGHEITSHTYSHRLFGPMRAVYGKRIHYNTLSEVVCDLKMLDDLLYKDFGYKISLSRPPHYIDRIPDSSTAYDAYRIMGYNYMAASFDGAGWQPLDEYEKEVSAMVLPLEKALFEDPQCLNGKIIFQKDGCNMNLRTPVADALSRQLDILSEYGYKVVTVSELLEMSAFEDISPEHESYRYIKELLSKKHVIGYKNNSFMPDRLITADEFNIMISDPEIFKVMRPLSYADMASLAREYADKNALAPGGIMGNKMIDIALRAGVDISEKNLKDKKKVKRADALELISALSGR